MPVSHNEVEMNRIPQYFVQSLFIKDFPQFTSQPLLFERVERKPFLGNLLL